MAKWIWKFGEFECYHNLLVHSRRQSYGYVEAPVWKLYAQEPAVAFRKEIDTSGGQIRITACGDFSAAIVDKDGNRSYETRGERVVTLPPGKHMLEIRVLNVHSFPALYVEGLVETDETWLADDFSLNPSPVGTWDVLSDPVNPPDRFPFEYREVAWTSREELADGGVLFDLGKETFAEVTVSGLEKGEAFALQFGESREEALDEEWSVIRFARTMEQQETIFPPCGFRYIYIDKPQAQIRARLEYLPLPLRGEFQSDEEGMNRIWDVSAYTFGLNCREFFLDGIKRDRWLWSADTYQSLFVNRYLYLDKDIEQRTLTALGGKSPFVRHINTIMDYTFFWFMSLYEHYETFGDLDFLGRMKKQMDEVMDFCIRRTDEDGFIRGIPGDWLFLDWAPMDKEGAVCGEQILYAKAMEDYSRLCAALGEDDGHCGQRARKLQDKIERLFWDEDMGAFLDSVESGRRNVTRQTNILAWLFLPCGQDKKDRIYENVICNPSVAPITTPYFTFYENQVHCLSGNVGRIFDTIRDYYGAMLSQGATTLYEQFDPQVTGADQYAMYGRPYEKSLCHAWSASPIYLLGRFFLGVKNTGIAYRTYEVRPELGRFETLEGRVPVPGGEVYVKAEPARVTVRSDIPGGTLFAFGKTCEIEPGVECVLKR